MEVCRFGVGSLESDGLADDDSFKGTGRVVGIMFVGFMCVLYCREGLSSSLYMVRSRNVTEVKLFSRV